MVQPDHSCQAVDRQCDGARLAVGRVAVAFVGRPHAENDPGIVPQPPVLVEHEQQDQRGVEKRAPRPSGQRASSWGFNRRASGKSHILPIASNNPSVGRLKTLPIKRWTRSP